MIHANENIFAEIVQTLYSQFDLEPQQYVTYYANNKKHVIFHLFVQNIPYETFSLKSVKS